MLKQKNIFYIKIYVNLLLVKLNCVSYVAGIDSSLLVIGCYREGGNHSLEIIVNTLVT